MRAKFSRQLKQRLKLNRTSEIPAFLGNLSGVVSTGTIGKVYVTLVNGEVLEVYNNKVQNISRLPVLIGYGGGEKLQIIRSRDVFVHAPIPDLPPHGWLHTFPNPDATPIRGEQILPLLVEPYAGLVVYVHGGYYELADGWHAIPTQTLDLTSYVPAGGALFVRLEVDNTGAISVSSGTAVSSRAVLEYSDIPAADADKSSLAAVKLYDGQDEILFQAEDTDIIDLRFGRQTITPEALTDLTDGGTTTLHNHDGRYPREYAGKTAAPTVNDDSGDGYAIGDLWIDETNDKVYQALNVSVGAAVWVEITGGGGAVDSVNGYIGTVVLDYSDVGADPTGSAATAEASAKSYADGLVVGMWDDRGSYDASGGAYPSSGGSGTAGAILKGDVWTISVAGTLPTGQVVEVGDIVRALVDTPGNTQGNWAITQNNIGYVAENTANKATTMTGNETSNVLFLTAKAIYDWVVSLFRERLTAARTYYVRTDGSNSNDGLANTAGGAFLTIQKALDVAAALDSSIYNVTINVADGTYTENLVCKGLLGTGILYITGNTTTPANCVIAGGSGIALWIYGTKSRIEPAGFKTTGSSYGILAQGACIVVLGNWDHATTGGAQIYADTGAGVTPNNNYTISAGAARHFWIFAGGYIQISSKTVTVSGTPAFSSAFVDCNLHGSITAYSVTFSGSATGKRYNVTKNGVIDTNGGGANYFPGNSAGTTATGGQYI